MPTATPHGWSDALPAERRVYANRNLRLSAISAIGFDMDHTLALYRDEEFEGLCFAMAVERLIAKGYPADIQDVPYDRSSVVRGLVVDKRQGNILKMDAYGYVARVRHGGRLLDRDERRTHYKRGRIRLGAGRYRVVDTLFDLPEGSLYTALVALKDERPDLIRASYRTLFDDIRDCVDGIHRDGSLKRRIMADLGRYFVPDPDLAETLQRFRDDGRRLFLLTNSEPEYTGAVMGHILDADWHELFDLIICSARKPGFFVANGRGTPLPPEGCPGLPGGTGRVFTGGDAFFLESKLEALGDEILYFGDHTYGDILRSKKSVGWRTAMIVPELEKELLGDQSVRGSLDELEDLEDVLEDLHRERERMEGAPGDHAGPIGELEDYLQASLSRRAVLRRRISEVRNPSWGSLFREGRAASRFGGQIRDVACVYTSRVSNFVHYPVGKFFVSARERLPHE